VRWIVVVGGDRVLVDLRSDVARVNLLALLEKARGMHARYCPDHPARPPIRHRAAIAAAWLEISLRESRHRP
jgi:hypothetical protein